MLSEEVLCSLKVYWVVSNRTKQIKLHGTPMDVNAILMYAFWTDAEEAEIEQFYGKIHNVLRKCKRHEISIVIGDLNVKVGPGRLKQVVGAVINI